MYYKKRSKNLLVDLISQSIWNERARKSLTTRRCGMWGNYFFIFLASSLLVGGDFHMCSPTQPCEKLGTKNSLFHWRLTKVLRNSDIAHSSLAILKLWIGHFNLFSIVSVAASHIPLQIKIEMHCSKNMPVGKNNNYYERVEMESCKNC